MSVAEEQLIYGARALPDVLAYLQNETELTRSTLVRILKESARLAEFSRTPALHGRRGSILKHELHRLLVDGIKYERLPDGAACRLGDAALQERGAHQLSDGSPGAPFRLRVRHLRL